MASVQTGRTVGLGILKLDQPYVSRSPMQLALSRFWRSQLAVSGLVIILILLIVAVSASIVAPYDPHDLNPNKDPSGQTAVNQSPNGTNPMGTDSLGRDLFSQLIFGSRVSLAVGFITQSVVLLIGIPIGMLAGFFGGWIDNLTMRITDVMYAFPGLLFVILLVSIMGRSIWVIFLSLGLASWPTMARVVRGQVMQVRRMDYVMAANSVGATDLQLVIRHIMPNILAPVIVLVTLAFPANIIAEATLTFLGLGVDPSTPTWGTMVNQAFPGIASYPWAVIFPSAAIAVTTLAFSFFGDGVRDAFDPRSTIK